MQEKGGAGARRRVKDDVMYTYIDLIVLLDACSITGERAFLCVRARRRERVEKPFQVR